LDIGVPYVIAVWSLLPSAGETRQRDWRVLRAGPTLLFSLNGEGGDDFLEDCTCPSLGCVIWDSRLLL